MRGKRGEEGDSGDLFLDALTNVLGGIIFMGLLLALFAPTTAPDLNDSMIVEADPKMVAERIDAEIAHEEAVRNSLSRALDRLESRFEKEGLLEFAAQVASRIAHLNARKDRVAAIIDFNDNINNDMSKDLDNIANQETDIIEEIQRLKDEERELVEANTIRARLPKARLRQRDHGQLLVIMTPTGMFPISQVLRAKANQARAKGELTYGQNASTLTWSEANGRVEFLTSGPGLTPREIELLALEFHPPDRFQVDFSFGPEAVKWLAPTRAPLLAAGYNYGIMVFPRETKTKFTFYLGRGPNSL